jgi:hypothetical protein
MKRLLIIVAVFALLSCTGNTPKEDVAIAANSIDEAKTKEVLDRHFEAFFGNDIDAIMADYADDVVFVGSTDTYTGKAAVKALFENVFKVIPKDSTTHEIVKTVTKSDIAYIIWKGKGPKVEFAFATDTFIIQNGKIIRQTFAGDIH